MSGEVQDFAGGEASVVQSANKHSRCTHPGLHRTELANLNDQKRKKSVCQKAMHPRERRSMHYPEFVLT